MAFKLFDRVHETSTSTGTGDITLAGAVTGFSTFGSRYSVGDTLYYMIQAVDASGIPSGAWEVGLGTYSAANTLTRTTVLSSSNSDALVSFTSGSKRVTVTMTALQGGSIREKLTAARTYYVATTGSDTANNGLSGGSPFLTIQKAVDVVCSTLDINSGVLVTIQVADGTYTGATVLRAFVGAGSIAIQGNATTPANVVVSTTSAHCFSTSGKVVYTLKDMKLQTTTSGWAIVCTSSATITHSNLNFGACASGHMYVAQAGGISSSASYAISGSSPVHVQASILGTWQSTGGTVTLTGTPNFSTGFVVASNVSAIYAGGTTYSGSATGKRYDATLNATISSNGGGANFFPGDSAGTTATGGQYA